MARIARWRRGLSAPDRSGGASTDRHGSDESADVLFAVPLPGATPDPARVDLLAGLLRHHQDALSAERIAAGAEAQTFWVQHLDEGDVLLVHVRARHPWEVVRRLARPTEPDAVRAHEAIRAALGVDPWDPGDDLPRQERKFRAADVPDGFPEVMAFATVLLPGIADRIPELRRSIDRFDDVRHELTGSQQEAHFVQRTPIGELYLIYARGEVSRLLEVIRTSDHPLLQAERGMSVSLYGIDLTKRFMPIPSSLHAWTCPAPPVVHSP